MTTNPADSRPPRPSGQKSDIPVYCSEEVRQGPVSHRLADLNAIDGADRTMIYSNACAYAIRALTRLTLIRPDGYVLLDELCEGTDLPRHFVAKIFQDLVRKGLLVSAKGRGGGFALARKPKDISLYEIVEAVDGTSSLNACVVGMARCDDKQPCPQHDQWKPLRNELKDFLEKTNLERMGKTLERKLEIINEPIPEPKTASKPLRAHP
jgi:Rrf2 family transcriptional regulator, iron-sulfur cluster assembly transcription factor